MPPRLSMVVAAWLLLGCGCASTSAPARASALSVAAPAAAAAAATTSREPPVELPPSAETPPPDDDGDAHDKSGGTWWACVISKAELEANLKRKVGVAPPGGLLLAMFYELGGSGSRTTMRVLVDLPHAPAEGKHVDVKGVVRHRLSEMGGAVEAGDDVTGTVSRKGTRVDVTLHALGKFRRMFATDDSIRSFSVAWNEVHHEKDCAKR